MTQDKSGKIRSKFFTALGISYFICFYIYLFMRL